MKYWISVILIPLLFAYCSPPIEHVEEIVITNVNVVTTVPAVTIEKKEAVVIRDNKIYKIGSHRPSSKATIIDGTDKYLMPGLTEMHAHIPVVTEGNDTLLKETLFLYLSQGITNIRGMLGDPFHLELKKSIASNEILSPRVYTSSPSMNGNSIPTVEEARDKVVQYKNDGYDFLKIHPGIKLEVWDEVEKTAKSAGIPYSGHVPVLVGIRRALDAQYGTVDHLDGFLEGLVPSSADVAPDANGFFGYNFTDLVDLTMIPGLVKAAKENNVAVVPTQSLFTRWFSPTDPAIMLNEPEMKYMPAQTRYTWRQSKSRLINDSTYTEDQWKRYIRVRTLILQEIDKQNVTILAGSDAPQVMNVPGFSLHHEMNDMHDAGISTEKIIMSATSNPAAFFSASDVYGNIDEGLSADLILINKNPVSNIKNMSSIEAVIVRGTLLDRSTIDHRLEEIAIRNQ